MKSTMCSYEFFIFHPTKTLLSYFAFSYCSPVIYGFISVYSSMDVLKELDIQLNILHFILHRVYLIFSYSFIF